MRVRARARDTKLLNRLNVCNSVCLSNPDTAAVVVVVGEEHRKKKSTIHMCDLRARTIRRVEHSLSFNE